MSPVIYTTTGPKETAEHLIGNEATDKTIRKIRILRKAGIANRLEMGEQFYTLRDETELYQTTQNGKLSFPDAVKATGVSRPLAYLYMDMWKTQQEYGVDADLFLVLCEEGVNLAGIKNQKGLKPIFKTIIQPFLDRLKNTDASDVEAVETLAEEITTATTQKEEPDLDLDELEQNVSETLTAISTAKTDNERLTLSADLAETRQKIVDKHLDRMQTLIGKVGPFLGWNDAKIKDYMESFADLTLSLQKQTYEEAKKMLKALSNSFDSLLTISDKEAQPIKTAEVVEPPKPKQKGK